jgi:outer membrane protein
MKSIHKQLSISLLLIAGCVIHSHIQAQDTLKLADAIAIAMQNNYDITLAANDKKLAELSNTAGAAGMLPTLSLSGARSLSVNNTYQQYYDGREREGSNAKNNNISGGLALAWTLFDGFDMFIRKDKLEELDNLSDIQLQSVVENTAASVIEAYYAIISQEKLVEVYKEAMVISSERKRIAKAGLNFGSSSELSLLQSSVDYNADSSAYIQQVKILQNNKVELNRLLCRDLFVPFEVGGEIPVNPGLNFDKLWEQVQQQNPEIRAARSNLTLAELDRKSANSSLYPRLNLSSGYNYSKSQSDVGIMSMNRNRGYNIGINASYTIFDGFVQKQNRSKAKVNLESARVEAQKAQQDTKAYLQRIFNEYQTNLQLASFENENVKLAERNLSIAQEKYRIGSSNDVELRETQQKLMDAENRYLTALYKSKASETELLRMSGGLTR